MGYYDTANNGAYVPVTSTGLDVVENGGRLAGYGLGFDAAGRLWLVANPQANGKQVGPASLWYLDVLSGATTWKRVADIPNVSGNTAAKTAYDIAFDANGNASILMGIQSTNIDNTPYIITVSAAQLATALADSSGKASLPTNTGVKLSNYGGRNVWGLAWGPDGQLYVSNDSYFTAIPNFYRVNPFTGAGTTLTVSPSGTAFGSTDLASCAFPVPGKPVTNGGLNLSKSPINANNGVVGPAGGAIETGSSQDPDSLGSTVVNSDGTVVAKYLVTVTNASSATATTSQVNDSFSVPSGFTLKDIQVKRSEGGDATTFTSSQFTIPGGVSLNPRAAASYIVSVTMTGPDFKNGAWSAVSKCSQSGAGAFGGGYVNRVTMDKDGDGTDNNSACVVSKVPPTGTLTLVKKIVNPDGSVVASSDDQKFTLAALGTSSNTSGISGTTGKSEVTNRAVIPGTYKLRETANTDVQNYKQNNWTCTGNSTALNNGVVTVKQNENVTCTVTNQRVPAVTIVKNAKDPADSSNQHIGKPQEINADGTVDLTSVLTVTNQSDYAGPLGPISDYFKAPAGLVWNGSKTATISYSDQGTGAKANDLKTTATESELGTLGGAVLASQVATVPAKKSVQFTITIPLKTDTTQTNGQTAFQINQQNLAQCTENTIGGTKVAGTDKGVANGSSVSNEDVSVEINRADNFACIPVTVPKPQVTVAKVDASGNALAGSRFTIYSTDPTADSNAKPVAGFENGLPAVSGSANTLEAKLPGTGTYYLVETQAPGKYELRPKPIQFNVTIASNSNDGVYSYTLGAFDQNSGLTTIKKVNNSVQIQVADITKGKLPDSGGRGVILFALLALLALACGSYFFWSSERKDRK